MSVLLSFLMKSTKILDNLKIKRSSKPSQRKKKTKHPKQKRKPESRSSASTSELAFMLGLKLEDLDFVLMATRKKDGEIRLRAENVPPAS